MSTLLQAKNLSKKFGRRKAVNDVSFDVNRGEIVGFMGPNGAGKSTTMRILTGFVQPDKGEVLVDGKKIDLNDTASHQLMGYLPEQGGLYTDITVHEFLKFVAGAYGVKKRQIEVTATLTRCVDYLNKPMESLSKGMRQRVFLCAALMHEPPVIILDEPTDGLDPNQKHEMRLMLQKLASTKAVLISTHVLEEAEAICDRVVVIKKGEVVANETPAELKARTGDIQKSFRQLTAEKFANVKESA